MGGLRPRDARLRDVLRTKGLLGDPVYVNLLLGSLGSLAATPLNLALAVERLPAGATWAAAGIGRFQFAMNRLAIAMGGHVRVGLEDNLWWDDERTELATTRGSSDGSWTSPGPWAANPRHPPRSGPGWVSQP